MKSFNKIVSIAVSMIIVLTVLFTVAFISNNVHHDCSGESCPICEQIQIVENTLSRISTTIIFAVITAALCVLAHKLMADFSNAVTYLSPIKLKVRMLN